MILKIQIPIFSTLTQNLYRHDLYLECDSFPSKEKMVQYLERKHAEYSAYDLQGTRYDNDFLKMKEMVELCDDWNLSKVPYYSSMFNHPEHGVSSIIWTIIYPEQI